jgi:hypothetical protein
MGDYEDDSPYPEVRAAVANTDDPDMPASTLRAWAIGLLWAILIPGLNQCVLSIYVTTIWVYLLVFLFRFFFFRYPSVSVGPLVAQLLSYPIGRAVALLPDVNILGFQLNPGPFSIKEYVSCWF